MTMSAAAAPCDGLPVQYGVPYYMQILDIAVYL
mgnify:CR=1 FL=1